MSELFCLELSVILWLVHVVVQAVTSRGEFGDDYLFGPRDEKLTIKSVVAGRAERALGNYIENYAPFVAMDLALIATQHTGGWGATIWILARIAYLPLYLAGTKYIRTGVWIVSVIGLIMMLVRLMGA